MNETGSSKWNNEFLKSMSLKTDPLGEAVITELIANNDFIALRNLFTQLDYNGETSSDSDLPKAVVDYFNAELTLPLWANYEKIRIAQNVFATYCAEISLLLNFKSLPLCYSCKNGAKVLAATGRLAQSGKDTSKLVRRLLETAQMVINVMSPDGLSPRGKGIITVKKVRLYHATIRYFVLSEKYNPAGWDVEEFGQPINQEEMAGTLMSFSALILDGLEQLGVKLSAIEKDSYMHCWNIVGHFIGLDPQLYPANYQEGWDLGIAIIKRNQSQSEDGKFLTESLLDFSADFFKSTIFQKMPVYLMNYFIKDVSARIDIDILKLLGVSKQVPFRVKLLGWVFICFMKIGHRFEKHSIIIKRLAHKYLLRYMQGLIDVYLKNNNVAFYIPDTLKANLKLK
ncbi:MAG: DUF2236 domain-containing protein [Bacteroidetes bacterium]|nr:DUF2236 domain-containing protein [Bacteroidota bacterium]